MKNLIKTFVGLNLLIGSVFISLIAHATPPTPPVQLILPKIEELAVLKPQDRSFMVPAQVRVHQIVHKLTLVVRTKRIGIVGKLEGDSQSYPLMGVSKGETHRVEIKIPTREKDGLYRVEAALQVEHKGKTGIVSKGVIIQVVEKGQQRLTTPLELRRMQVSKQNQSFQEQLIKKPKQPEIRLLMDQLIPVPDDRRSQIQPYRGLKHQQVKGTRPPAVFNPYILNKIQRDKTEGGQPSSGLKPAPVPPLFFLMGGQVVFEDWYTHIPCNPFDPNDQYYPCDPGPPKVLTPLANASITIWLDGGGAFDSVIAVTETDENGGWSYRLDPAYTGSDVYYSVSLENEKFNVRDATGSQYLWASTPRNVNNQVGSLAFGQEVLETNQEAAQIFAVIDRGWNHIVTEGGQDPGLIAAQYPDSCLLSDGTISSCWDSSQEVVKLEAGTSDSPDTILHEYGHALLHYAFGHSIGGGLHSFSDLEQDSGIAFNEGWANAFALSVCPDGWFSGNEGSYEDPEEWPACTIQPDGYALQNDGYEWIEGFKLLSQNRKGERHEGRVAAAITDFLDAPNDDNGGNEDLGKNGYQDANENERISLSTIYQDSMWGYDFGDFISYFIQLRANLTSSKQVLADEIMTYNWMNWPITGPVICVASKVAMAMSPEYAKVLDGLRSFRDKVMKPMVVGRHWMQSYYSHSPEMAVLLIGDSEARKAGQIIVEHFAGIGQRLKESQGLERLSQSKESVLPPRVMESIKTISKVIHAKGSKELKQKLAEVRELLRPFEGLSVSQAAQKVSKMQKAGREKDAPRVQPLKFAPGSQQVDWDLIKKNVPKGEWPGTNDKRTGEPVGAVMPQREGKE